MLGVAHNGNLGIEIDQRLHSYLGASNFKWISPIKVEKSTSSAWFQLIVHAETAI